MAFKRDCVALVTLGLGAALLAGCSSTPVLHGGKLGPRYGVQVGYLTPVPFDGGEQGFSGSLIVGGTFRIGADLATPLGLELGVAYSGLKAEDASVGLLSLRARALYAAGVGGLCWRAGMQMIRQYPVEGGVSLASFDGAAIDLGLVRFFGRRGELGFNYSMLIPSDNVTGTLEVTAGINF